MFTIDELKKELCIDCPDKPMDSCKCGCLRKAVLNNFIALQSENEQLKKQLDKAVEDMKRMAYIMREYEMTEESCCFACIYSEENLPDAVIPHGECPGCSSEECFEWCGLEADNE